MTPEGEAILSNLRAVAAERARRRADPLLETGVRAVKRLQHARFEATYGDLLAEPRYTRATRFFLDDLYGPHDFTLRDTEFARIVPPLVKLFPRDVVTTVRALSELHSLSESLDSCMAQTCASGALDARRYVVAWQATGRQADREQQIDLMLGVGSALERYTRNPLLGHSLRLMRAPARAAGLGELQTFLETGFDTFRAMRGSAAFLATIAERERALAARLFTVESSTVPAGSVTGAAQAIALLGQLP